MVDEKKVKFTNEEIKILKDKYQFYNIKDKYNIKNISNNVNGNCKNILLREDKNPAINEKDLANYDKDNQEIDLTIDDINSPNNDKNINNFETLDNGNLDIKLLGDVQYNEILKKLNQQVDDVPITCANLDVLKNKDYMKNYYFDIYGERVQSSLEDYFINYYSKINTDKFDDQCVPVNLKSYPNYLFIPDQFATEKYLSSAYNVDWQRIVNPLTIY